MPNEKQQWRDKIREVEVEYLNVRFGLDWMRHATEAETVALIADHSLVEPPREAFWNADNHLAGTYLIRMYSVFERCIKSVWRLYNPGVESSDGARFINDVAEYLSIGYSIRNEAQRCRLLRNDLIHEDFHGVYHPVDLEMSMKRLLDYINGLDASWG